jgi:surface protein
MYGMFRDASSFNSNISNWNVSSVTDMGYMFYVASSFNSDISRWGIISVTDMRYMFEGASSFNQNLCPWGPKLPVTFDFRSHAIVMFFDSGCFNKFSPTSRTGPWCAVADCNA